MVVILSILCACAICDMVTKDLAQALLLDGNTWSLLADTIRLRLVYNLGGFLSVGGSTLSVWPSFLSVWVPCVLLVVLAYALFSRPGSLSEVSATALVFAGGAGNLADRLAHGGSVVDFIYINLPGLRNAVFNFADVAVTAGFFLFLVTKLREKRTTSNSRIEQPA